MSAAGAVAIRSWYTSLNRGTTWRHGGGPPKDAQSKGPQYILHTLKSGNAGMSELYDDDILLWSERQAKLLRRLAAGERVNDQVDWDNLVEEVEDVGRSQLSAVESLLFQALVHMLKAAAWPLSTDAPSWRGDARGFRAQARRRYAPSMRQRLDLAGLYADALRALPETMDGQPPRPVPHTCAITLDELLSESDTPAER